MHQSHSKKISWMVEVLLWVVRTFIKGNILNLDADARSGEIQIRPAVKKALRSIKFLKFGFKIF